MRNAHSMGVLLFGLVLATGASADVTIRIKETRGLDRKQPEVSTGTMRFNADCMASSWEGAEAEQGRMIFRGDKNLMWVVNDERKSYQQIDQALIDQMSSQMTEAQAQMKAQMEKMPPEQRAQVEEMMKKMGRGVPSGDAPQKMEYRKTGETKTIDGQPCTKYEAYWGKDLVSYVWVAPYSSMKLTESDAAVFKKMSDFMAGLTSAFGKPQKQDYIPMHELNGVPLLTQRVENGKVTSETLVESVSHGAVPSAAFDLPAGYKLQKMEGLKGRK